MEEDKYKGNYFSEHCDLVIFHLIMFGIIIAKVLGY